MEQKKTLWIILASGCFLAVIILTSMILFNPKATDAPQRASVNPIEKPVEKPAEETSAPEVALVDENAISNLTAVDETAEKTDASESENKPQELKIDATVTIDLNQTGSSNITAKSEAAQKAIDTKKSSETAATIYTATPSGKSKAEVAAETKAAAMNKNKGTQVKQTTPVEPVVQAKYWVQAASYTSKKTADLARATLDQNRIPAEVFTFKDSKNNLFYRVRVGPYTTKSEAEYWQNRICTIDSFKDSKSYITVN
mgnify:FL=1